MYGGDVLMDKMLVNIKGMRGGWPYGEDEVAQKNHKRIVESQRGCHFARE